MDGNNAKSNHDIFHPAEKLGTLIAPCYPGCFCRDNSTIKLVAPWRGSSHHPSRSEKSHFVCVCEEVGPLLAIVHVSFIMHMLFDIFLAFHFFPMFDKPAVKTLFCLPPLGQIWVSCSLWYFFQCWVIKFEI